VDVTDTTVVPIFSEGFTETLGVFVFNPTALDLTISAAQKRYKSAL